MLRDESEMFSQFADWASVNTVTLFRIWSGEGALYAMAQDGQFFWFLPAGIVHMHSLYDLSMFFHPSFQNVLSIVSEGSGAPFSFSSSFTSDVDERNLGIVTDIACP